MNSFKNNVRKMIVTAAVMMAGFVSLATLTGCDEYGLGGYGGYGSYDSYYAPDFGGGFGPIDSDVFDAAAADWDAYIRE